MDIACLLFWAFRLLNFRRLINNQVYFRVGIQKPTKLTSQAKDHRQQPTRACYPAIPLPMCILRYADHKFFNVEKSIARAGTGRRKISKTDYQAQGVLYLPESN